MENRDELIIKIKKNDLMVRVLASMIIIFILVALLNINFKQTNHHKPKNEVSIDSLKNVVDSLNNHVSYLEREFDRIDGEYERILFEYQYGISNLKETHPSAYKEFHRIIGFKERYTEETKKENELRLKY